MPISFGNDSGGQTRKKIMDFKYLGLTDAQWLTRLADFLNTMSEDDKRYATAQASFIFIQNRIRTRRLAEIDAEKEYYRLSRQSQTLSA